jgi:ABC-type uncharacterized transport system fused permease/ATPase subunit
MTTEVASRNEKSREWLTRDLLAEWLKLGRPTGLTGGGEIGVNPDQRIHEDARRLTEFSSDLGIGFRFGLFQANQQIQNIISLRGEEGEKRRLGLDLEKVLVMVREIVDVTAKLTWITAGYGWISIVAPIVIASPAYFSGRLSFGELMVVIGGFIQVN